MSGPEQRVKHPVVTSIQTWPLKGQRFVKKLASSSFLSRDKHAQPVNKLK